MRRLNWLLAREGEMVKSNFRLVSRASRAHDGSDAYREAVVSDDAVLRNAIE